MKHKRNHMTAEALTKLYPNIKLMKGFDRAFVGVVPAPASGTIAVYDSMEIIKILYEKGFKSKYKLSEYFEKTVKDSQTKGAVGPLFMQCSAIIPSSGDASTKPYMSDEQMEEALGILGHDKDEDLDELTSALDKDTGYDSAEWHTDYGMGEEKGQEGEPGYDSDSDSDSDSDYSYDNDDEDDEDLEDSGYDSDPSDSYMEITVDIGINDPDDCMICKDVDKIRHAMRMIFPKLPRLELISEANFVFRAPTDEELEEDAELEEFGDEDDDDSDSNFPYTPPGSL